MMNYINITVRGKIARAEARARVVCGNSDYAVRFDFDAEWEAAYDLKTARFVSEDGSYADVQFEGDDCAVPILRNTRTLLVGVFAGNLRTTTAALIHAVPCITDPDGTPADPTPDVYAQIMERFNAIEAPAAVLYTAQELTDEQKATARENIGIATPDWDENNETAAGYIKNRPFYEGVIETLLDPTIENWRKNGSAKCSWRVAGVDYIDVKPSDLEHGAGFQYKLGDVTVDVWHGAGILNIKPSDADVHILKRESNIKQIDPKFIPERLFDATGATNAEITAALQENKLCYVRDADGFWFCNSYDRNSSTESYSATFYRIAEGAYGSIDYTSKRWTSDGGFDDKRVIEAVSTITLKDMAMTVVDAYDEITPQSVKTVNGICVGAGSGQGSKTPPSGMTFPIIFSLGPTSHGTGSAWIRDADGVVWKGSTDYGTLRVRAVPDVHLNITGATVGQIAKITAVDDNGKPTAWEAVDMPSGDKWELINEIEIPEGAEESNTLVINKDLNGNDFSLKRAQLFVYMPKYTGESTVPTFAFATINGRTTGDVTPMAYTDVVSPSTGQNRNMRYLAEKDPDTGLWHESVERIAISGSLSIGTKNSLYSDWRDLSNTKISKLYPITSIGTTANLIYAGCKFWLYGVRS